MADNIALAFVFIMAILFVAGHLAMVISNEEL